MPRFGIHPTARPDIRNQDLRSPGPLSGHGQGLERTLRMNNRPAHVPSRPTCGRTYTHANTTYVSNPTLHTYVQPQPIPSVSLHVERVERPRGNFFRPISTNCNYHSSTASRFDFGFARLLAVCVLVSACMLFLLAIMV